MSDQEQKLEEDLAEEESNSATDSDTAVKSEAELEAATADRLNKTFVTGEKLEMPPDPDLEETSSTSDDDSTEDSNRDGPTAAEAKEEAKLEAETKAKEAEAAETEAEADNTDGKPESKTGTEAKEEDAGKDSDKGDTPQITDAYYRAAIHRGWTDADIKAAYDANPDLTVKTLGNIYEALNRSSQEYAAFGRAHKERLAAQSQQTSEEATAEDKSEFKGVDIEALRKEYPNEPIVDLVKTMQDQNKTLFDQVNKMEATKPVPSPGQPFGTQTRNDEAIRQEAAAIEQQVEAFFRSDELKGYQDFYGTLPKGAATWDSLTPGQKMNRWTVVEMMDQMLAGANALGRDMKHDEALNLSHISVTEPIREKVIREEIKSKTVKRSKSLTFEPSGTAQPAETKPSSQKELEAVTEDRLAKVFGK